MSELIHKRRLFSEELQTSSKSPHLSCILGDNVVHSWSPKHMDMLSYDTLALVHVLGDVLDSLDIGSLIRSFIGASTEKEVTFGQRVPHAATLPGRFI